MLKPPYLARHHGVTSSDDTLQILMGASVECWYDSEAFRQEAEMLWGLARCFNAHGADASVEATLAELRISLDLLQKDQLETQPPWEDEDARAEAEAEADLSSEGEQSFDDEDEWVKVEQDDREELAKAYAATPEKSTEQAGPSVAKAVVSEAQRKVVSEASGKGKAKEMQATEQAQASNEREAKESSTLAVPKLSEVSILDLTTRPRLLMSPQKKDSTTKGWKAILLPLR